MNLLDRLKQAEAAATPGPWDEYWQVMRGSGPLLATRLMKIPTPEDTILSRILRNHAANLIRLVELSSRLITKFEAYTTPDIEQTLKSEFHKIVAPFLAEEDAR